MLKNEGIYIVGGGYSLRDKNLRVLEHYPTIVTNKSILYVPKPNYFVTMDYSFLNKMGHRFRNKFEGTLMTKIFIVNLASGHLVEENGQIIDQRYGLVYKLEGFNVLIKSYKKEGIGLEFGDFRNGDNTGFSALQLAIVLGYKEINLLGIDLTIGNKTHFHGGYGESPYKFQNKLDEYYEYFKNAIQELNVIRPDIQIYSCSETSKLNDIIPYKKL